MPSKFEKFLPYAGVLAGILFAVGGFLPSLSEKAGDPDAMAIMNDNATRNTIGAISWAVFCVAMLFFAAALRRSLRSGEGGESTYSGVAYAGAVLVAGSQALVAWLMFAGIDAADNKDKAAFDAIAYLGVNNWLVWIAPSAAMFLAAGLGGLRNAVLPTWLGIVTVILGVMCFLGPGGIVVYLLTPVWLVVTGVVLGQRQQAERPTFAHSTV
jgi:uncharacterized membrane protein